MRHTAHRLLRLIALLQARRQWSGAELAERMGVDRRSIRRDVERLRELGYPVRASSGVGGGYQLGAGAPVLPMLLDEWTPVIDGSDLGEHPFEPIAPVSVRRAADLGDDLPVGWRHRSQRYTEKLATPDTAVADLIGDVDPVKVADLADKAAGVLDGWISAPAGSTASAPEFDRNRP